MLNAMAMLEIPSPIRTIPMKSMSALADENGLINIINATIANITPERQAIYH